MTDPRQLPPATPDTAVPPIELTRRVASLFPGQPEVLPEPRPTHEEGGLFAWAADIAVNWSILLLALVNLALVLFDYTYLDMRHIYQAALPAEVVARYDLVKGIEPHRSTETFVKEAEKAFAMLSADPNDPAIDAQLALAETQAEAKIVREDPFLVAGLRGVSEQAKNRVRKHMWMKTADPDQVMAWSNPWSRENLFAALEGGKRPWKEVSVNQSWKRFFTRENLRPESLRAEIVWFRTDVAPLMNRNYWQTYGEDGRPNNHFWLIDCFFLPIFLLEFLIRGARSVKKGTYPSFRAFAATRWYDVVYFVPVIVYALPPTLQGPFHLLRCASVGYRMQRLGLINPVAVVQAQVAKTLDLVTDLVNVKLLGNYQASVQAIDFEKSIKSLSPQQRRQLTTLIERNLSMVLREVLPDVTPALEKLIARAANQALEQAPAYAQLRRLPFFGSLPDQFMPALVGQVIAGTQVTMLKAINDPENMRLTNDIIDKVVDSLIVHMAEIGTEQEVKNLVVEMLEEQKRKVLAT